MTETMGAWFRHDDDNCDPLLGHLESLAEAGWRVSLLVGGLQVSGTMVTVHEYLKAFDEQLATYDTDMGSHAGFLRHGVGTAEPSQHPLNLPDAINREPDVKRARWIHLMRAKITRPGEAPQRVPLWRGRTSGIDGWSLLSRKHR
ncbi:hypothetical protein IEQ44_15450 [Nocardioides sp. Y6]|uniref:Resolvase/invertase-type recombinase catalytic domain-containing protein n=1 Tax=Nocardioides malaquae TaxID=2773426 RepID=A0ABR9RXW3_9ACTN|nr:hypothetical protein [Nocardioides malaquae]MBE7326042.1 hypothetical protein [Nocardioides malaquae]